MMELEELLNGFCGRAIRDERLQPTHISLYLALLRQRLQQGSHCPFPVSRREIMAISRISSRVTYHKRMRELHRYGYIRYTPTYNYYRGSTVQLLPMKGNSLHRLTEVIPEPIQP